MIFGATTGLPSLRDVTLCDLGHIRLLIHALSVGDGHTGDCHVAENVFEDIGEAAGTKALRAAIHALRQ